MDNEIKIKVNKYIENFKKVRQKTDEFYENKEYNYNVQKYLNKVRKMKRKFRIKKVKRYNLYIAQKKLLFFWHSLYYNSICCGQSADSDSYPVYYHSIDEAKKAIERYKKDLTMNEKEYIEYV